MQFKTQSDAQFVPESPKIVFSQKVFGKATKGRTEDPSMFELLKWNTHGLQHTQFKKDQKFTDPEIAYLNMISKQNWISQSQQNFLNYHKNELEINEGVFQDVQNYIQSQQSGKYQAKLKKKSNKNSQQKQVQPSAKQNQQTTKKNQNRNVSQIQKNTQNAQPPQTPQRMVRKTTTDIDQRPKSGYKRPQSSKGVQNMTPSYYQQPKTKKNDQYPRDSEVIIQRKNDISEQQQQKLIQKFKQTTRWIPNSAFTTYFGKPPFQNYGRGNTKPVDGGLVYGTYLYSHNVFPHRGSNSPAHVQSYPVALMKAQSMGKLVPTQPKTACGYLENKMNNQKEKYYNCSGAIEAQKNNFNSLEIQAPDLRGVEKFGGSKKSTQANWKSQVIQESTAFVKSNGKAQRK